MTNSTKNTSIIVNENGIETSKNFENKILSIFRKESNYHCYNEHDITIVDICILSVSWGSNYGRFRKSGQGVQVEIKGIKEDETFKMEFDLYTTIQDYDLDKLKDLEYGFKPHSDAKKRITIELLENEIEEIFNELICS